MVRLDFCSDFHRSQVGVMRTECPPGPARRGCANTDPAGTREQGRSAHLSRPQRELHRHFKALLPGAPGGRRLVLATWLHRGLAGPRHLQSSTQFLHQFPLP